MAFTLIATNRLMRAIAVICLGSVASCNLPDTRTIDFNFTGHVLDADTNQPIEGAYVVAIYKTQRAGVAAVASHCTKTRGMLTGKDGKFSFPVEKLDSYSPSHAEAAHVDYILNGDQSKPWEILKKQTADSYSDRNIILEKQKSGKDFVFVGRGVDDCVYATNPKDAAPAAEFLRRVIEQYGKYDTGVSQRVRIGNTEKTIRRLEKLDGRMPYEIVEPAAVLK